VATKQAPSKKVQPKNGSAKAPARNGANGTAKKAAPAKSAPGQSFKNFSLHGLSREDILKDYRIASESRQASLLGRREVLTGKAKFGIFGDGKEVAQLAMARAFKKGDFRSGYYRDQTFMFALGISDVQKFFAQLYAHTDVEAEPSSAGRSMNGHFGTRFLNEDGSWKNLIEMYNSTADVSPTASQMPRLVGLAYASKLFRELDELKELTQFSLNGNEVAFGTIGNASCAEGMFWEAVNAIGVLKSPAIISIWDDGYGISVPNHIQVTKDNVGELLKGFQRAEGTTDGYDIYTVRGWDYAELLKTYQLAAETARREHVPAIIHVVEMTQPQGHSTSGSHERYKSKERLQWEKDFDPIAKMREWILAENIATTEELDAIEKEAIESVRAQKEAAWKAFTQPIYDEIAFVNGKLDELIAVSKNADELLKIKNELASARDPFRRDVMVAIHRALLVLKDEELPAKRQLIDWKREQDKLNEDRYSSCLHSNSGECIVHAQETKPIYTENSPTVDGREVLQACFDAALKRDPRVVAFGEDVGKIGDVNQAFAGLQAKHGEFRVTDTGIRECTILGQGIGLAMRGLRPITEIQYLDYILYALQLMSDDLATVQYRTKGGQKAPVIIRTRGHRLEGVWHSGSPMAGIINLVRGMHVCVPRNMTQAAGFYNTLLKADEPALVVEVLSGYRLKERIPDNVGEFTLPLGVPEVLKEGSDVTIVTYGACCKIAMEAAELLKRVNIDVEIIDVQTLLPFDTEHKIVESLKKSSRVLFFDEDVPGGTTAFMMQEVLEKQKGWKWLDSEPKTLAAKPHRPAYGTDGNYWSKPEAEHVFEAVYEIMNEANPQKYPVFYK
jgi:pyruvate/2-oxoglutarate/acetoin dehydrogenase E1 component/TPP-dependent pyruvate/acetoin dehydrogenase alpha subunit